jgi:hypothetical protein
MEQQATTQPAQHPTDRKVVIKVSEALLTTLRTTCAEKAKVSLLGRIQGKHPGLKALTAWAGKTLHHTLILLSLKADNFCEITFSDPEGRTHALTQTELVCENATISFSSWRLHGAANTTHGSGLDFPVWLQVVNLSQILRDDSFLKTIGEHIGQVIAIDNSEAYRAKLFGPRIRILVSDINNLPNTVVLPQIDGEGEVEYQLEYSGLPNQCGRCRALDHQVRHCPRRDLKLPRREHQVRSKHINTNPTQEAIQTVNPQQATPNRQEQHPENSCGATPHKLDFLEETPKTTPLTELPSTANEGPSSPQVPLKEQVLDTGIPPELQPNDTKFPQLTSPGAATMVTPQQSQPPGTPQTFIWRRKPGTDESTKDKDKGKLKTPVTDSVPLTRQGYRSGRLAEDFWTVLNIPSTPGSAKKKLRVIPLLTKNYTHTEYLVDKSKPSFTPITTVHIAELLAGIPWTLSRVKQHIIAEVSQALHKFLIFNNQSTTPIYKWDQGKWFSHWSWEEEEHTCTMYVYIAIPESKLKIRKGRDFGWRRLPAGVHEALITPTTESVQEVEVNPGWQEMLGNKEAGSSSTSTKAHIDPPPQTTEEATNS